MEKSLLCTRIFSVLHSYQTCYQWNASVGCLFTFRVLYLFLRSCIMSYVYYLCVLKHNCICGFQKCPGLVFVHGPLFSVLSFLLQKFLWLNEEVLSLLCFLIVGMEFSWFLWEIFLYYIGQVGYPGLDIMPSVNRNLLFIYFQGVSRMKPLDC